MFLMSSDDLQALYDKVIDWLETTGVKIVAGIIVLIILFILTSKITKALKKRLIKKNVDKTIVLVFYNVLGIVLKVIWVILFLSFVGIDTAGISAVIASVAIALGLAVQGSLSNVAGGIVIIVTRPFKIGDYITAQDNSGTVENISLIYTTIITIDNKKVSLPNGDLANGVIINASAKEIRRVDQNFQIAYEANYDLACKLIKDIINKNEMVLKDKSIFVKMTEMEDSSIVITTRVWVKSGDYLNFSYFMLEEVKKAFDKNNIEIPYNKMDINLKNK